MTKIKFERSGVHLDPRLRLAWVVFDSKRITSAIIHRLLFENMNTIRFESDKTGRITKRKVIKNPEPAIPQDELVARKCCFENRIYPNDWSRLKPSFEPSIIIMDSDDVNQCRLFLEAHRRSLRHKDIPVYLRTNDVKKFSNGPYFMENLSAIIPCELPVSTLRKFIKQEMKKRPSERAWFSFTNHKLLSPRELFRIVAAKKINGVIQIERTDIDQKKAAKKTEKPVDAWRYYILQTKDGYDRAVSMVNLIEKRHAGQYEFEAIDDPYMHLEEITEAFAWRHFRCIVAQKIWMPESSISQAMPVDDIISFIPLNQSHGRLKVVKKTTKIPLKIIKID